jgi:hypothetical protein
MARTNDLPLTDMLPPLMTRMVTDQFRYADTGEWEEEEPSVAAGARAGAPRRARLWIRWPRLVWERSASRAAASRDSA